MTQRLCRIVRAKLWLCWFPLLAQSPVPIGGPNVNMVAGATWPDGDPFLQRQNEPSLAVSTRNPLHLLAGANDYRTVDLAVAINSADPDAKVTGDGWLGLFKSLDGGQTWRSTLLPGCPYPVPQCQGSAFTGLAFQAGSDPVVRAGSNGMFYYSGLAFDRDHGRSAITVSRFIDDNNLEVAGADPIRYLGGSIVALGSSTLFLDKPWVAVDIPRAGAANCSIPASGNGPAQSFPAGNVYVAWAAFDANDAASQIYFSKSTDCGVTWSQPRQLSQGSRGNQGAAIAIDPQSGDVYVTWRQAQLNVLTVSANDATRPLGQSNPVFTFGYSGFANGDGPATAVTGVPTISTTATPLSPPGIYPITIQQGTLSVPDYLLAFVGGTLTITPAMSVPSSGTTCNGTYNGTFVGDLTISSGQTCIFAGGRVTGNITQTGGSLYLNGPTVDGNVTVQGGGVFSFATAIGVPLLGPGVIHGNLTIQNLPAGPEIQVCAAIVGGTVNYRNNAAALQMGAAGSTCGGITVGGDLVVQGNSASVTILNNVVLGNLAVTNNTGPTQMSGNIVKGSLSCSGNTTISGGQCSK